LLAGKNGIGLITKFDTADFACKIAGQVKDFNPDLYIDRKEQKKMDIFIQFAMAAAQQAMEDSGLTAVELSKAERERFGVVIGSGIGGLSTIWEEANGYRGPGGRAPSSSPA
jgi:3-oxoacyl-[acyl-carrier-protein] synthase II (EC 2.3.1.41)